jgi:hypothetical protein
VTKFQRLSGDVSTFFGNTMLLMAVLAAVYDMSNVYCGLFARDDIILYLLTEVCYNLSRASADIFNLESKLLTYEFPYFCSKFIIMAHKMLVVPDPLKILKLERNDILNWVLLKEYRVSACHHQ